MQAKKFLIFVFSCFILILGAVILFNYSYDRYSIFNYEKQYFSEEPNQNFIKMDLLINKKITFDSFLFGSSRVGKISPQLLMNGNYYNMTYSEGLPSEHLKNIKTLLEHNIKIKNILIALDDFSYQVNPSLHSDQPMRKLHYKTNNVSSLEFYSFYFRLIPDFQSIYKKILCFKDKEKCQIYDFFDTGMPLIPQKREHQIESNYKKHVSDKSFKKPTHYDGNYVYQTISDVKKIKNLCILNNINCIFIFNPIHATTYLDTDQERMILFKNKLVQITDFYDFSGLNSITIDNYYWYETSHYRVKVGKKIAARIFNDKSVEVPKDFGILVTKENIDQHLENLRQQIQAYDLNTTLNN